MPEHGATVLMIEDNPIHARLIHNLLKETGMGYTVITAGSLAEGLQHIARESIDIILLDLVLPDSQELDTFSRVRAATTQVPVIILTSLDDVSLAAKAVEAGAQD